MHLQGLAQQLRAPGGSLENPCLLWVGGSCAQTALDTFFSSLDALRERREQGAVVVSALGNSLIAADHITDVVRERLTERFGDAGRGFLLVDRMAAYGPRTRTGRAEAGFLPRTLGEVNRPPPPFPFSMAGVLHVAQQSTHSRFELQGETRGTLHWLDHPDAGAIRLELDDRELATLPSLPSPERATEQRLTSFAFPPDAGKLDLFAEPGATLYGLALERSGPGVVLDTLGVPSVDASLFLNASEKLFVEALASRQPRLVTFFLGGNETKRVAWGKSDRCKVEKDLRRLIERVKKAAPQASCLVVGPIDAVKGGRGKRDAFAPRPELPEVNALQRRAALASGCAYFDLFAAMGGDGSLHRFHAQGLLHDDLVHPRGDGLDLLGELVSEAVLRAYARTPPPPQDSRALMNAWTQLQVGLELPASTGETTPARSTSPLMVVAGADRQAGALQRALAQRAGADHVARWTLDGRRSRGLEASAGWLVFPMPPSVDEGRAERLVRDLRGRAPQASCIVVAQPTPRDDERAARIAVRTGCGRYSLSALFGSKRAGLDQGRREVDESGWRLLAVGLWAELSSRARTEPLQPAAGCGVLAEPQAR